MFLFQAKALHQKSEPEGSRRKWKVPFCRLSTDYKEICQTPDWGVGFWGTQSNTQKEGGPQNSLA